MINFHTRDPREAVSAVETVYCPHSLEVTTAGRGVAMRLQTTMSASTGFVALEYGAAVRVDAGDLEDTTLIMHAVRGQAAVRQRSGTTQWRTGKTMVISGNQETNFSFDRDFSQLSLRLEPRTLTHRLGELTGREIEGDVSFALESLPPDVESAWSHITALAIRSSVLPETGAEYLSRFALDLLLTRVPHSHSTLLAESVAPKPSLYSQALHTIETFADYEVPTPGDLAARMGVSLRTLERAFRAEAGATPSKFLRDARLDRVRAYLAGSGPGTNIADVAAAHGFFHPGRFAQEYKARCGELPSQTVRRVGTNVSLSG